MITRTTNKNERVSFSGFTQPDAGQFKDVNLFGKTVSVVDNEKYEWANTTHLHLKVTEACNANCSFCVEHCQNRQDVASIARYEEAAIKVIEEMKSKGLLQTISITGGEPSLVLNRFSERFVKACETADGVYMNTNGTWLKDGNNTLKYAGLFNCINVSRHSVDEAQNAQTFGLDASALPTNAHLNALAGERDLRLQCLLLNEDTENVDNWIDAFPNVKDFSFRQVIKNNENTEAFELSKHKMETLIDFLKENAELQEQVVQDNYVYETWIYRGVSVTVSFSDMTFLVENSPTLMREFILHPNLKFGGSWYSEDCLFSF